MRNFIVDLQNEAATDRNTGEIIHLKTLYNRIVNARYLPASNDPNDYQSPDAPVNVQKIGNVPVYSPD